MCNSLPNQKIRLFADDANVFIISNDIVTLYNEANASLNSLQNWLVSNKLQLNIAITNYILFKPSELDLQFIYNNHFDLSIDNQIISRTTSARYLGVTINEQLDWSEHIIEINNKIKCYIGIFYKYKRCLSGIAGKLLYCSFVLPKLNYGIEIYGISNQTTLKPLELTCNKLLRSLQNKPLRYHTKTLYTNYNTLPVQYLFQFSLCKLVHKRLYDPNSLPNVITSKFNFNNDIHNHNTRKRNDFHYFNNIKFDDDPLSLATRYWNNLPENIKICPNWYGFLKQLKEHLFNKIV